MDAGEEYPGQWAGGGRHVIFGLSFAPVLRQ